MKKCDKNEFHMQKSIHSYIEFKFILMFSFFGYVDHLHHFRKSFVTSMSVGIYCVNLSHNSCWDHHHLWSVIRRELVYKNE